MFRWALGLMLVFGLAATGCHTMAWNSTAVPGTNQRLVVGAYQGFFNAYPQVWVYENGKCEIVDIEFVD